MKHLYRFLVERDPVEEDGCWRILPDERHHLTRVLRMKSGDAAEYSDGKGTWGSGSIRTAGQNEAWIIESSRHYEPPPTQKLILCIGALRPGSIDELIPSLTELGVDEIHVFLSEGTPRFRLNEKTEQRWQRVIVSSARQCRRAWLPTLVCHDSITALLKELDQAATAGMYLHPGKVPEYTDTVRSLIQDKRQNLALVIGGEKGFSPQELQQLSAGPLIQANMGDQILRAFTAAIAATAIFTLNR
ncbi:MAG: 16S rRNA (uracil(1498)-N(3))-methyltransferase [Deltaproteobacteria bacterium]|nr:16S rRNA (uracil(1498)-N(3))-methyltransferase [Deltaproteobacteria bacterium]